MPATQEIIMGQALHTLGIDSMSVEERIALVKDIWDSVAVDAGLLAPNALEKAELDRRLAEDDAAPDDAVTWETVKSEAHTRWQG
jgi:putative addiction module component (TIGR02574 family)